MTTTFNKHIALNLTLPQVSYRGNLRFHYKNRIVQTELLSNCYMVDQKQYKYHSVFRETWKNNVLYREIKILTTSEEKYT